MCTSFLIVVRCWSTSCGAAPSSRAHLVANEELALQLARLSKLITLREKGIRLRGREGFEAVAPSQKKRHSLAIARIGRILRRSVILIVSGIAAGCTRDLPTAPA